ncbi:MAG: restriction endonuclease subunit S [Paludibacteraceae bacterium]|nr:restriction endonuclease subunit S [Paludibacteraceae bacterium]
MSEWKKVRLGDCCVKIGSGSTPKGGSTVYIDSGTSFIRSQNVYNLSFDYNGLTHITEEAAQKLKGVTIYKNDILLNITGDSVARTCIVPDCVLPARVNQHVAIIRVNEKIINSHYLNYFLTTPKMQAYMLSLAVGKGASRNAMTKVMIENFEVPCPPIETQHRIASILSRYDDLIENYQRQIKLLEEAAQRLYKEWFVDFRFPGHETTKFVDGIPEGWNITSVDNIIEKLESGSRPKGGIDTSIKEGIASVGAENVIGPGLYNFSSEKLVSYDFYKNAKKGKIENKDILIYKDGAYIGRTSLFQDNFPHKEAMVNEHVFLLHTKEEICQYFLFFTLYQKVYFEKMQKLNKNAAQPGLNQNAIKSLKLLMPNKKYIVKFDEVISPMMKKLFALANQVRSLTEARDRLLPKLMNGEVEV